MNNLHVVYEHASLELTSTQTTINFIFLVVIYDMFFHELLVQILAAIPKTHCELKATLQPKYRPQNSVTIFFSKYCFQYAKSNLMNRACQISITLEVLFMRKYIKISLKAPKHIN